MSSPHRQPDVLHRRGEATPPASLALPAGAEQGTDPRDEAGQFRRRTRAVIWLHTLLAAAGCAAITGLMFVDTAVLRAYRNLNLPATLWHFEDALSRHAHNVMLAIAAVLLVIFPPRRTVESVRTIPGLRWRTTGIAGRGPLIAHAACTAALAALFTHSLKPTVGRVRPCDSGDSLLFMPLHGWHVAYPSGHATTVFAIAFVLTRWRPKSGPLWFALCLPLAWARVHTDAHFVSDVIAAFFVCLAADRLAFAIASPPKLRSNDPLRRLSTAGMLALLWLGAAILPPILTAPAHTPVPTLMEAASRMPPDRAHLLEPPPTSGASAVRADDGEPAGAADGAARTSAAPMDPDAAIARSDDGAAADASERLVGAIYRRILEREPDEEGLARWTQELLKKQVPLEIVKSMATSGEFRRRLHEKHAGDRALIVTDIYERLLGRAPSDLEVSEALATIAEGESGFGYHRGLDNLVLRLTISREYLDRFGSFAIPFDRDPDVE